MRVIKVDKKPIFAYLFTLVLIILAYQGFYRFGFGADTMANYLNPLINIESEFTYGRYISYALEMLFFKVGVNLPEWYHSFYLLFILVVSSGAFIFQQVILSQVEKKGTSLTVSQEYLARVLLILPFISTLFAEYMMFPECFVYCFYILFDALSLLFFSRKKYILAALFLILGGFTYQVAVIPCAIYALIYLLVESEYVLNGKALKTGLVVSFACLFTGVLNYLMTIGMVILGIEPEKPKSLGTTRLLDRLSYGLDLFWDFLKNGRRLLPVPYINLFFLLIALLLLIASHKKDRYRILTFLFTAIVLFTLSLVIPMVQYGPPRVIYVLYASLGCLVFLAFVQMNEKAQNYMGILIVIVALIQLFSCQQIAVNHYISNKEDLACARAVLSRIENYERESGITVSSVCVCDDGEAQNYYEDVYYTRDQINERVAANVAYSLLEYVYGLDHDHSEKRFHRIVRSYEEVREEYFPGQNWDFFDVEKQVMIDGDVAYWCIY